MRFILVGIILLAGCTGGWRTAGSKSVLALESLSRAAESFELKHCGVPMELAESCKAGNSSKCTKLAGCHVFAKSLLTSRVAILTAKHALIDTSKNEHVTQALIQTALRSYLPIKEAMEAWK